MFDYSQTKYFDAWINESISIKVKLIFGANLLHVALKLLGFKRVNQLLHQYADTRRERKCYISKENLDRLTKKTRPLLRYLRKRRYVNTNCLASSLMLWLMLYRQGLDTKLLIGFRTKGAFEAHSWLEYGGVALNAGDVVRSKYQAFNFDFNRI